MKLSVIISVHNRERLVGAAVRSLLRRQQEVNLDIIVVDDGSTDQTREMVAGLSAEASRIRLFAQPNIGVAAARNGGLRLLPETAARRTAQQAADAVPSEMAEPDAL